MTHSEYEDFADDLPDADDLSGSDGLAEDTPELADEDLKAAWQRLAPESSPLDLDRDAVPHDEATLGTLAWMRGAWASVSSPEISTPEMSGPETSSEEGRDTSGAATWLRQAWSNVPSPDVDAIADRSAADLEAIRQAWRSQPIPDPILATEQGTSAESRWLKTALQSANVPNAEATDARTEQLLAWTADAYQAIQATPRRTGRILQFARRVTPLRAAAAVLFATLSAGAIQSSLQESVVEPQGPATALQMRIAGDSPSFAVPRAPMQASLLPPIVFDLDGAARFAGVTFGDPLSGAKSDDPIRPLRAAVEKRDYSEALRLGDDVLEATRGSSAARSEALAILANCARGLGRIDEADRHQEALMRTLADAASDAGSRRSAESIGNQSLVEIAVKRHLDLVDETGADATRILWHGQKASDWRRDDVAADAVYSFDPGVVLALIAGQMIADDTLELDGDVSEHLPTSIHSGHAISLRHLLTHTSGLTTNRRNQLVVDTAPGTFRYEKATTSALYVVLNSVADDASAGYASLTAYAAQRVFGPIGAATARLDSTDGEPQLVASVADMTRVGELILNRGRSGDLELVPAPWLDLMIAPSHHRADSGFQVWLTDEPVGMAALGPHDSNLYVFPEQGMVVVRAQAKPFSKAIKGYEPEAQSLFGLMVDRG